MESSQALDAWRDCDCDGGYVLPVEGIRNSLPKIAARIPCRSVSESQLRIELLHNPILII